MKTHKCEKDGKYIISTNSDCVVTDVETGIVLAVVLAKTQKVIQAISDSFTTSVECSVRPFVEATSDIDLIGGGEDYLPAGYKRIEYLESSGTQYIDLDWFNPATYKGRILFVLPTNNDSLSGARGVCGGQTSPPGIAAYNWGQSVMQRRGSGAPGIMYNKRGWQPDVVFGELNDVVMDVKNYSWNGQKFLVPEDFVYDKIKMMLFATGDRSNAALFSVAVKILRFAWSDESHNYDLVPVLDDTGTPCMYDKVSKTCFYNSGTGDFIYPTDEYAIQTLDLDYIVYGKMTECGIRRLYKVPAGETMTRDDYAAANGYKEIIEPPMPREGYWTSQWKETDTQLILEWVETEAPAEEV